MLEKLDPNMVHLMDRMRSFQLQLLSSDIFESWYQNTHQFYIFNERIILENQNRYNSKDIIYISRVLHQRKVQIKGI